MLSTLAEAAGASGYYSLCQAVDKLARQGSIGWLSTKGGSWLAIETREQLEQTQKVSPMYMYREYLTITGARTVP